MAPSVPKRPISTHSRSMLADWLTQESKYEPCQSDKERQAVSWPHALVQEQCEHLVCRPPGGQIHYGYQDAKEAKNVQNQDKSFDLGQCTADHRVEKDSDEDDRPIQQGTVPILCSIVWMIEDDQALNLCAH